LSVTLFLQYLQRKEEFILTRKFFFVENKREKSYFSLNFHEKVERKQKLPAVCHLVAGFTSRMPFDRTQLVFGKLIAAI